MPSSLDPSRRSFVCSAGAAAALATLPGLAETVNSGTPVMNDALKDLLHQSMSSKRGVNVALASGNLALVVTEVTDTYAVGKSQLYDRIVVRLDQIQAAFM